MSFNLFVAQIEIVLKTVKVRKNVYPAGTAMT